MRNVKKLAVSFVAGISLASGLAFSTMPTQAAKVPSVSSSYWYKTRTVYTKRRITIQKVQTEKHGKVIPGYKQKVVATKHIKKGTKLKVRTSSGDAWALFGKIPGVGKAETKSYYWRVNVKGNKWFTLTKPKKVSHK